MPDHVNTSDTLVIGAGPAGLTSAMYLSRFMRSCTVIHDGTARASRIPLTHNVPGFPDGVTGPDLLSKMLSHAAEYGARIVEGHVVHLSMDDGNFCAELSDGAIYQARGIVLATGILLNQIDLPHKVHEQAIRDNVLRYCPVCDAYEHRGKNIAVLGADLHGAAEALFLRQYSNHVTLIPAWTNELEPAQVRELEDSGVSLVRGEVDLIEPMQNSIKLVIANGESLISLDFDVLYPALGVTPRTELAVGLGLSAQDDGRLDPLAHARTDIPGVYAAGDIVEGLDQISVAMGHGAIAATKLHNWLREQDGHVIEGSSP